MKLHSDQCTKYYFEKSYKHQFQSKGGKNALHHTSGGCQEFLYEKHFLLAGRRRTPADFSCCYFVYTNKTKPKSGGEGWGWGGRKKKHIFPKIFVISNAMQPGITHLTISKEMISYKCNREQSVILFHDLARKTNCIQ